jgi:hypothetical protein
MRADIPALWLTNKNSRRAETPWKEFYHVGLQLNVPSGTSRIALSPVIQLVVEIDKLIHQPDVLFYISHPQLN